MQSLGFGGGFLMTIYEKNTKKAYVLDARYSAPLAAHEHMYDDKPSNASKTGKLNLQEKRNIKPHFPFRKVTASSF